MDHYLYCIGKNDESFKFPIKEEDLAQALADIFYDRSFEHIPENSKKMVKDGLKLLAKDIDLSTLEDPYEEDLREYFSEDIDNYYEGGVRDEFDDDVDQYYANIIRPQLGDFNK